MRVFSVAVKKKWYKLETNIFRVSPERVNILHKETYLLHQILWL
jgi:hypothetical protein